MKMLKNLLDVTYKKVKAYYHKCEHIIREVANSIDEDVMKSVDKAFQVREDYANIKVISSVALLSESKISRRGVRESSDVMAIYLLGTQWQEKLQQYMGNNHTDVNVFGKITSEVNRMKIIDYLLQHKEITMAEAVEYLGTSVMATNYHINMMADSKMLKVRNEGRKLFFSLDRKYFDGMISSLRDIADQIVD